MNNTDKQPETIGEWLDWAEEQGYEWAKEAMVEVVMQHGAYKLLEHKESLSRSVLDGFTWPESEKGRFYWQKIYESV